MEADDVRVSMLISDSTKSWLKKQAILMNWDMGTIVERLVSKAKREGYEAPDWGKGQQPSTL